MKELKVKPFSEHEREVEKIPVIINQYINAPDKTEGDKFKLVNDGKSKNTGDGMSYYDRLSIFLSGNDSDPIYSTGFQLWRPGHAFSTNRPENSISGIKLINEKEDSVIFGYKDGTGKIFVKACDNEGQISQLEKFDMSAHEKAVKSRAVPEDDKEFESWVGRNLPNIGGASWHYDVYPKSKDDSICVVIARHCSRSVDATHDYFRLFVWKKGQGVAISDMYPTNGRTSHTKFSTNYLRCKVSVDGNSEISFEGKSQFGDVEINKTFHIVK